MKVRLFLDTNVFMDILVEDRPSSHASRRIIEAVRNGLYEAFISTQSILDAAYALRKSGKDEFFRFTDWVLGHINVETTDAFSIRAALQYNSGDFEDDALFSLAQYIPCDYFITSDKRLLTAHGTRDPHLTVISPEAFVMKMDGVVIPS